MGLGMNGSHPIILLLSQGCHRRRERKTILDIYIEYEESCFSYGGEKSLQKIGSPSTHQHRDGLKSG